jgi:hypothetical protein
MDVNLNPVTPAGQYRLVLRIVGADGQPRPVNEPPGATSVVLSAITITAP